MSLLKNVLFLSTILFIINIRSFKFIIKNESNKDDFNIEFLKNISNRKKSTLISKSFKKKRFKSLILLTLLKLMFQFIII